VLSCMDYLGGSRSALVMWACIAVLRSNS